MWVQAEARVGVRAQVLKALARASGLISLRLTGSTSSLMPWKAQIGMSLSTSARLFGLLGRWRGFKWGLHRVWGHAIPSRQPVGARVGGIPAQRGHRGYGCACAPVREAAAHGSDRSEQADVPWVGGEAPPGQGQG